MHSTTIYPSSMNRANVLVDELLEPFPNRRGPILSMEKEVSLSSIFEKPAGAIRSTCAFATRSNRSFFDRSSRSNMTASTSQLQSSSSRCMASSMDLIDDTLSDSITTSTSEEEKEDNTSLRINPISVASIVGDDVEFRRFQQDLRNSKMVTGFATQQLFKQYIDTQGRTIAAKRKQDPELSKVKNFAPAAVNRRDALLQEKNGRSQQTSRQQLLRRSLSDQMNKLKRNIPPMKR